MLLYNQNARMVLHDYSSYGCHKGFAWVGSSTTAREQTIDIFGKLKSLIGIHAVFASVTLAFRTVLYLKHCDNHIKKYDLGCMTLQIAFMQRPNRTKNQGHIVFIRCLGKVKCNKITKTFRTSHILIHEFECFISIFQVMHQFYNYFEFL